MAENLAYLPSVSPSSAGSETTPYFYVYDYQGTSVSAAKATAYYQTYGALYNWYTVNTSKLCPTGWHVPSDAEWTTLTDFLGGIDVAGGKLKETDTLNWQNPNTGATNESGFTALPGGTRNFLNGEFQNLGKNGGWWSSTEWDGGMFKGAYYRTLSYYSNGIDGGEWGYTHGHSVRCIKD
jgi:uncharacterized protein (TIGR02145 family)